MNIVVTSADDDNVNKKKIEEMRIELIGDFDESQNFLDAKVEKLKVKLQVLEEKVLEEKVLEEKVLEEKVLNVFEEKVQVPGEKEMVTIAAFTIKNIVTASAKEIVKLLLETFDVFDETIAAVREFAAATRHIQEVTFSRHFGDDY